MVTGRETCSRCWKRAVSDIVLVTISRVHWKRNVFFILVLSRLTCLPKLLGTSIAWLWSLFPFLCRGRVARELLFCHMFTALVTILGGETALMLSSGNHVHSHSSCHDPW